MDHRISQGTPGTPAHRFGVRRMPARRMLVERALPGLAALLGLAALALLLLALALRAGMRQARRGHGRGHA